MPNLTTTSYPMEERYRKPTPSPKPFGLWFKCDTPLEAGPHEYKPGPEGGLFCLLCSEELARVLARDAANADGRARPRRKDARDKSILLRHASMSAPLRYRSTSALFDYASTSTLLRHASASSPSDHAPLSTPLRHASTG